MAKRQINVPVSAVLEGARRLSRVFVVGRYANGRLYVAGSTDTPIHQADMADFVRRLDRGDYAADEAA